jgi:hypothetical protein
MGWFHDTFVGMPIFLVLLVYKDRAVVSALRR